MNYPTSFDQDFSLLVHVKDSAHGITMLRKKGLYNTSCHINPYKNDIVGTEIDCSVTKFSLKEVPSFQG